MSRSRKRNKEKTTGQITLVLPENMSQEEMKNLIVSSLLEYDKVKMKIENEAGVSKAQARRDLVGYKDYSDRKLIQRIFMTLVNSVGVLFRILFMPKNKISGAYATTGLMKFAVSGLFSIAKWVLWGLTGFCFLSYPLSIIIPGLQAVDLRLYPTYIGIGILTLLLAQMFRIAGIEIEKMDDHNYIVDIFAAVAATVAIVISVVIK